METTSGLVRLEDFTPIHANDPSLKTTTSVFVCVYKSEQDGVFVFTPGDISPRIRYLHVRGMVLGHIPDTLEGLYCTSVCGNLAKIKYLYTTRINELHSEFVEYLSVYMYSEELDRINMPNLKLLRIKIVPPQFTTIGFQRDCEVFIHTVCAKVLYLFAVGSCTIRFATLVRGSPQNIKIQVSGTVIDSELSHEDAERLRMISSLS